MSSTYADHGIDIGSASSGQTYALCPQCSHSRKKSGIKCLSVNLDQGVWKCHHPSCGWSGGLQEPRQSQAPRPKVYRVPTYAPETLQARTLQWFARRGIPEAVLQRRQISAGRIYMPQDEAEVDAVQFPYIRDGVVVNIKYRDSHKHFRMESDAERLLYGLDDVTGDTLTWVEGEMDALAYEAAFEASGCRSVVSVPDGAPDVKATNYPSKFAFLDSAMGRFDGITKHLIAGDADAPGQVLAEELARRLGPERCWRVTWPTGCKDCNETLVTHGAATVQRCVAEASPWPIRGIITMAMLAPALDALYEHGVQPGLHPGWETLAPYYRVQVGELTIVGGVPAHGKTRWLSHLIVKLAENHHMRFAVFSPETKPERFARLLLEQYIGKPFDERHGRMTQPEMWEGQAWLSEHFCIIAPEDTEPTIPAMLALARTQVQRMGITGVVLDPWSYIAKPLSKGQTLTQYVGEQLVNLKHFCTRYDAAVWLVAHPTKMKKAVSGEYADQYPPPTPYDVSDSAHFFNSTDNAISIWRNTTTNNLDTEIHVQKIKYEENGQLGKVMLRYDPATKRYFDPGTEPQRPVYSAYGSPYAS